MTAAQFFELSCIKEATTVLFSFREESVLVFRPSLSGGKRRLWVGEEGKRKRERLRNKGDPGATVVAATLRRVVEFCRVRWRFYVAVTE